MRAGSSYRCPVCGDQSPHPVACVRCNAGVVDEHGNSPPPLYERKTLFDGYRVRERDSQATGLADMIGLGAFAITAVVRRVSERARHHRHNKAMKRVPRSLISQANGPLVRIAGRAEVLEPSDAARPEVAFSLERVRERSSDGSRVVETRVRCSKFVIRDESGTALVDDDFVVVLPKPAARLPANGNALVVASEGQQVEVCGPAKRQPMPDLGRAGNQHGYRKGPEVVCFDGRPDALLLLRPLE